MASNNVALTAIGIACIAAAGAGGYFALRQSATPGASTANTVVATPGTLRSAAAPRSGPVSETEAVVSLRRRPQNQPRQSRRHAEAAATESLRAPPPANRTWPTGAAQTASSQPVTPEPVQAPHARRQLNAHRKACSRPRQAATENLRGAGGLGRVRDRPAERHDGDERACARQIAC
jgi:hypothetical protein